MIAVIPISGGMDSTVILHHIVKELQAETVYCVTFNYGQRHAKQEIHCVLDQIKSLEKNKTNVIYKPIILSFFSDISTTSSLTNHDIDVAKAKDVLGDPQTVNYVPNRNMILLSIAMAYAESIGASTVFHGAAQVDSAAGFWDGSTEFIDAINKIASLNRRNQIEIKAPLIDKSKGQIINWGYTLGVDFSKTHTCYEGNIIGCGECTACSARIQGFIDAGIEDPKSYKIELDWDSLLTETD